MPRVINGVMMPTSRKLPVRSMMGMANRFFVNGRNQGTPSGVQVSPTHGPGRTVCLYANGLL